VAAEAMDNPPYRLPQLVPNCRAGPQPADEVEQGVLAVDRHPMQGNRSSSVGESPGRVEQAVT
jgi:hypothetical protein